MKTKTIPRRTSAKFLSDEAALAEGELLLLPWPLLLALDTAGLWETLQVPLAAVRSPAAPSFTSLNRVEMNMI